MSTVCKVRDIVLVLLVLQTTGSVLLTRLSRTQPRSPADGPAYRGSVVVLLVELVKLPLSLVLTWRAYRGSAVGTRALRPLLQAQLGSADTLKCAVPALSYTLQGNLIIFALAHLDAPTYQTAYQAKTVFTALFARALLAKHLQPSQWMSDRRDSNPLPIELRSGGRCPGKDPSTTWAEIRRLSVRIRIPLATVPSACWSLALSSRPTWAVSAVGLAHDCYGIPM